jgi:hypothetical protein
MLHNKCKYIFRDNIQAVTKALGKSQYKSLSISDRAAIILVLFLQYVEQNATALNVDYNPKFHMRDVAGAYGTTFFPKSDFVDFICDIASELGMQTKPFRDMLGAISTASMSAALNAFAEYDEKFAESGDCNEDGKCASTNGREINEALRLLSYAQSDAGIYGSLWGDSYLCALVVANHIKSCSKSDLSVCDPVCGEGGNVVVLYELPDMDAYITHIGLYDISAECVCIAAMRMFLSGFRGTFDMRVGDSLSANGVSRFSDSFDVVLADAPSRGAVGSLTVEGARGDEMGAPQIDVSDTEAQCVLRARSLMNYSSGYTVLRTSSRIGFAGWGLIDVRRSLISGGSLTAVVEFDSKGSKPVLRKDGGMLLVFDAAHCVRKEQQIYMALLNPMDFRAEDMDNTVGGDAFDTRSIMESMAAYIQKHTLESTRSANINVDKILADPALSLRLSSYIDTVGIDAKLRDAAPLEAALAQWQQAETASQKAAVRLGDVLDGLNGLTKIGQDHE